MRLKYAKLGPRRRGSLALFGAVLLRASVLLCPAVAFGQVSEQRLPFQIHAPQLTTALIQLSQQSKLSIVFSDQALRGLPGTTVIGRYTTREALDRLLAESGLEWELIDGRVIAVFPFGCGQGSSDCPPELVEQRPAYVPGLEETYIYGTQVTGSRIRRSSYTGGEPVEIFTRSDIELSGAQNIGELLKFVPAVVGNATSTAISNGGDGTSTVTLRGLPANNTLVLINGRRVANDGLAGDSVDLNSIPPAAVERIEILKDGASAIYGSDAIAGVVNVITRQDFHGFLAEAFYGATGRGDLETSSQTLQYGTALGDGTFLISGSLYRQEPIFSRDRRISASADTRPFGGTDQRSSATPDARVVLGEQTLIATPDGYRPATSEDLFNYQAYTSAVVPFERASLFSSGSYDFNNWLSALAEFTYLETEANAVLAPTPVLTAFQQNPLVVAADNPYNDFGVDLRDVRRRLLEFPVRRQVNESEVMRAALVLEGLWTDWHWDVGYDWSRSEATETSTGLVNADRLRRAIGPAAGCLGPPLDDCVAVDLSGPRGSITPDQVDYVMASGEVSGYYEVNALSLNAGRAVPAFSAGRADIAFGVEHRREETRKEPGDYLAANHVIGGTNFQPTRGSRDISEVYAEALLPLWVGNRGLAYVELETAVRVSHYSDFGTTSNPGAALRWQVGPAVLLRASYTSGFRAPSLNELYEGITENQAFINDPCANPVNVGVLPGCSIQSDPSLNQFLSLEGGNPELEPETSRNWGLGLVWTPPQAPGLSVSADLYRITQKDVVATSAQYVVEQNARNGSFSERVERDAMGNLVVIEANNLNIGRRQVSGADLNLNWQIGADELGQFQIAGSASWIQEYLTQQDANARELNVAGTFKDEASEGLGGLPQWKAQLDLRWTHDRWDVGYQLNFVDSMREKIPETNRTRRIESWIVQDVQLNYRFDILEGLRLTLGIDNLFDTDAPLAVSAFNDNIDGRTHDLKGRFWYARLSQRF